MRALREERHGLPGTLNDAAPGIGGPEPRTKSPGRPKKRDHQSSLRHTNSLEILHKRKNSGSAARALPDGGLVGREGRQFRVGNVGNNGKIYLRPIARAPRQASQPNPATVIFPTGPAPTSRTRPWDADARTRSSGVTLDTYWSEARTPRTPQAPPLPLPPSQDHPGGDDQASSPPLPRLGYKRAQSFSTLNEATAKAVDAAGLGGPPTTADRALRPRPKTADQAKVPILKVQIPNHRLGSPRFSAHGTAFLHSSIYTQSSGNDELRSSTFSHAELGKVFPMPPGVAPPSPSTVRQLRLSRGPVSGASGAARLPPWRRPHLARASIVPRIYDDLTFAPTADDPAIVRFSPATGSVVAATVPRLVAQITSPSFLDYDLLSDFFLTFRSFMSPADLVAYLLARLEWAVSRSDQVGKIVTVRTFVALRHWILNYFVDDFVPDYSLRADFCDSLNLLCATLKTKPEGVVKEWKILGELKKCWRRTCALYWDESHTSTEDVDAELRPGGHAGVRGGRSTLMAHLYRAPIDTVRTPMDAVARNDTNVGVEGLVPVHGVADAAGPAGPSEFRTPDPKTRAKSLSTELSAPVLSCSIPAKSLKRAAQAVINPHAGPPELTGTAYTRSPSKAVARAFSSTGMRRDHAHKRSGSFSDALRDRRAPLPQPKTEAESSPPLLMAIPFAASLIRGHCLPPTLPTVRTLAPSTPASEVRFFSTASYAEAEKLGGHEKSSNHYAPGMRKLFGSVRRVLHYKDAGDQDGAGNASSRAARARTHRVSPGAKSPSKRTSSERELPVAQAAPRVDLLAAIIADEYRQAINDERGFEARAPARFVKDIANDDHAVFAPSSQMAREGHELEQSAARERVASSFTQGSKSIVIVDDTRARRQTSTPCPPLPSPVYARENPTSFGEPAPVQMTVPSRGLSNASQGHRAAAASPRQRLRRSMSTDVYSTSDEAYSQSTLPESVRLTSNTGSRIQKHSLKRSYSSSLRTYPSIQSQLTFPVTDRSLDLLTVTESQGYTSSETPGRSPARMLRRLPGGDLRAANNVADLRQPPRPRSAGSLTVKSESICSSIMRGAGSVVTSYADGDVDQPRQPRRRFSLGALAEGNARRSISLIQTHSSQPNLRPSFEIEVARLAQLPDDEEDGGIESTLLKLEGRFERRPSTEEPLGDDVPTPTAVHAPVEKGAGNDDATGQIADHQELASSTVQDSSSGAQHVSRGHQGDDDLESASAEGDVQKDPYVHTIFAASIVDSDYSYSSTPLLERGLSNKSAAGRRTRATRSTVSVPPPLLARPPARAVPELKIEAPAAGLQKDTNSLQPTPPAAAVSRGSVAQESFLLDDEDQTESFLLDDDQELSDLSSELSTEMDQANEDTEFSTALFPRVNSGTVISEIGVPFHPLRHPPSPPPSADRATPTAAVFKQSHVHRRSPSPGPSPVERSEPKDAVSSQKPSNFQAETASSTPEISSVLGSGPKHLPFILEYESHVLAQQFTLLEKDALNGIDWKELVELRMTETSLDTRNWFRFIKSEASKGVGLVIARFNVMVKWALSEIVLTQDLEERARTVSKYIHLAAQARRLRNFATMYQMMTALLSTDCSRLKQTWQLISDGDLDTFKELEALVQPVRNFHKLRVEMETATVDDGCIPFLGIYTHDLMFNSQRPSKIESQDGGPTLINFERYRVTAAIVKSLLRLLEASSKYSFQPVEGVANKCLWMAALSDDEIRSRSRVLEQTVRS